MKTRSMVALALLAGAAIGAVAVQGLHAQTKAPVYVVTQTDITDLDAYQKEYVPVVQATIKAAGGRLDRRRAEYRGARRTAAGYTRRHQPVRQPRSGQGLARIRRLQGRAEDRRQIREIPHLRHRGPPSIAGDRVGYVTPAKAGVQPHMLSIERFGAPAILDARFRGHDSGDNVQPRTISGNRRRRARRRNGASVFRRAEP